MQADSIASHLRTASATPRLHMNTTLRLSVCSAKASIMPTGRQRKTRTAGKLSKPSSNKVRGEVAVHALGELVGEVMTTQEGLQPAVDVADRVDEQADVVVDVEVDDTTTGSHGTSLIPLMMRDITTLSVTVSHVGNYRAITLTKIPIKDHKAIQ